MLELFNENHYFICSGGMKPARFRANQNIARQDDGNYYLTEYSLRCKGLDFVCRFAAMLYAIIAAAMAMLMACGAGVILLAAMAGAVVGAAVGAALCGDLAAIARTWITAKTDAEIQGCRMVVNRPGPHLNCKVFGNQITFAPNVKNAAVEYIMFAANIGLSGLEGFMYAYGARGVGLLLKAPSTFLCNFATNYLASLTVKGTLMRGIFAGYSAANAHYTSPTEGFDGERVADAALDGGLFVERAAWRLYQGVADGGYKNPETGETNWHNALTDVSMILSMGGIPGGGGGKDATAADVSNMAKQVANPIETAKAEAGKVLETAKQFRNKLKRMVDGAGAHEKPFDFSSYKAQKLGEKLGDFGEKEVAKDYYRSKGYDKFYEVQNPSGNGVDIVARNSKTGDMIKTEVKTTKQERLWNNGETKEIPMSKDQKSMGGEDYTRDRLEKAANGEDGYTDGESTRQAEAAIEAERQARKNGAKVDTEKLDIYVDENGNLRSNPVPREWKKP